MLLILIPKLLAGNTQGIISPQRASVLCKNIRNRFLMVKYQALPCSALLSTQRSCFLVVMRQSFPQTSSQGTQSAGLLLESVMMMSSRIQGDMQTRDSYVSEIANQSGDREGKTREREGGGGERKPPHTCVLCFWQH